MDFDDWLRSLDSSLVHTSSICAVPERLKKSKEDAYLPRVLSIGPRFNGSREDLLAMEQTKLRCMNHLISRRDQEINAAEIMAECYEIILNLESKVRASYGFDIDLKPDKLAKLLLVDCCFLLELVISSEFDDQLTSRSSLPSPAYETLRNDDVLSDLTLLENQIPLFLLYELSKNLFNHHFGDNYTENVTRINNLFLSVLGYSQLDVQDIEGLHILDIVHFYVNGKHEKQSKTENLLSQNMIQQEHHVTNIIDAKTQQPRVVNLKLKHCALRLLALGGSIIKPTLPSDKNINIFYGTLVLLEILYHVLYQFYNNFLQNFINFHISEEVGVKVLDFNFKFKRGKLEIEQLHITKTTKAKWCNLIAWEHHKKYKYDDPFAPRYLDQEQDERQKTSTIVSGSGLGLCGGKFTWAALIFDGLICSVDDVQLLKDRNIVVDHVKMTNQELVEFFRTIALGVDHGVVDSSAYIQMVDDINNYSKKFDIQIIWNIMMNSFRHRQGGVIKFMNRDYNFAATMVFVLAALQTVYTMVAYYAPK